MHRERERMSITDELREWMRAHRILVGGLTELTNIADRIDAEHESKVGCTADEWDYWESTHVELPKDADGEYIHVGERVQLIGNDPSTVSHMSLAGDGWRVYVKYDGGIGTGSGEPKCIRHYHTPTVEDVLREFGIEWEYEQHSEDRAALLAEYAAKLRLAGDDE